MILKTDFSKGIKEVCLLIGCINPPSEQIQLFYEKLKGSDLGDFNSACRDEQMISDLAYRGKLIYPVIRQAIEKYQIKRQNEEAAKLKNMVMEKDFNPELKKLMKGFLKTWE